MLAILRSVLVLSLFTIDLAAKEGEELFVRRIWPLFQEKCLACHGNDSTKIKGGYDMRTQAAATRGGDSEQPAIVVGQPDQSPLYLAATRNHADWEAMPPKEADRLTPAQLEWIRAWITSGAIWPEEAKRAAIAKAKSEAWSAEDGVIVQVKGALTPEWAQRRYSPESLWAYQSVQKPDLNSVSAQTRERHPIDALLALHLPREMTWAGDTAPRQFIRRATFDLTGLPPKPEEVEAFVAECGSSGLGTAQGQKAVERLIERLLKSPHYGERMARHWLDVVRYADSSGFANDYERGNAWRYRDYVVRSFHSDKPYNRFILEQIAGDELKPDDPEMLIATGFLRMGPWELTGMEVAKVARQRFLDDVTNSVGETFLAHSLQCARCHDHKFDPVPTHDYYAIQACFATTQLAERPAAFLKEENTAGFEEKKDLVALQAGHIETLRRLDEKLLQNAQRWFAEKGQDPSRWNAAVEQSKKGIGKKSRRAFSDHFSTARQILAGQGVPEDQYPPKLVGFEPQDFGNERVARKGLERLRWELERYEPYAFSVYNGLTPALTSVTAPMRMPTDHLQTGELEKTAILSGGDPFSPTQAVKPGVLSAMSNLKSLEFQDVESLEGRRLALAHWIANPANPLTTRTIVNRVWLWHFGQAIAGNPNNFGSTGKKPTHPELLDFLAAALVENGWSLKAMHRLIMTSAAYRRSATLPSPQGSDEKTLNREEWEKAYAVFKPRRLMAEELRDAMLSVSGELNLQVGGIPNRPEINREAAMQPRMVMGTFASAWVPNALPTQRHRRSLYALKIRGLRDPFMEVFNEPAPDFSCEAREVSTVTPQVFSLFNSESSQARALALAARLIREAVEDPITRLFHLAYGRPPTAEEKASCEAHWRTMEEHQKNWKGEKAKPPHEVRREAVEENTGEKFTFVEKLPGYTDFIPDLQPTDCDARTRALADVCLVILNSNEFAYAY